MKAAHIGLITVLVCAGTSVAAQNTVSIEERFTRLDRNGDGKLTSEELPRRQLFRRLDQDKDGFVTLKEARRLRPDVALEDESEADFETRRDLAYGKHERHRLDIYSPKKAKSAPVMVYVHGGGWRKGDKSRVGRKPPFFTGRNWILVSVNYRLLPDGKHPRNVQDIASALAWVHDHIREYGGDPDSIFLMGHSAGCHLASLVATDGSHLDKVGKSLKIVRGVVALDTQAYDIPTLMKRSSAATVYKSVFGEDLDTLSDASPMKHLASGKSIPPFLICYSRGMGRRVNRNRRVAADAFARALKKYNVRAEVVDASDRSHGEINRRFGDPQDDKVTGRAVSFLDSLVRRARDPRSP